MKIIWYIFSVTIFLAACTSASESSTNQNNTHHEKEETDNIIEEESSVGNEETHVIKEETRSVKEQEEEAEETEAKQIESSDNKNLSCLEVLKKLEKAKEIFDQNPEANEWRNIYESCHNDPIVKKCKDEDSFKKRYNELDQIFGENY